MPPRTCQRSKGNPEKKSGFKPFTSRPAFGGRGLARSIPTAKELRAKVLANDGTVVIGAENMNPTEQNRSYWELHEKDMSVLTALFTEYEKLQPQYNACKASQRIEWSNQVTCCKALFCLNAIYRMQGNLDSRLDKKDSDRGTSDCPLKSEATPFGLGIKPVLDRLGTNTDIMYGWWLDESPNPDRTPDVMKAVECVKNIIKEAFEIRSWSEPCQETFAIHAILVAFQHAALTAVQEFERRWTQKFPITFNDVLKAMAPIRNHIVRNLNGEPEEVNIATSDHDNDAEHADAKGETCPKCKERDGIGEGAYRAASEADAKDDVEDGAAKETGKPKEIIVEGRSVEHSDEDAQLSERGAGSDAEIIQPGKRGPRGKKRRITSMESQPTPPPRAKTRSQTALVNRPHPEEESSAEESDEETKLSTLRKQRPVPPTKASVRTSSRKPNDTSEPPRRTATSMDVDVPLPQTRNPSSAGGKPGRSTKPAAHAGPQRTSSVLQPKRIPNHVQKPFLDAMGNENDGVKLRDLQHTLLAAENLIMNEDDAKLFFQIVRTTDIDDLIRANPILIEAREIAMGNIRCTWGGEIFE